MKPEDIINLFTYHAPTPAKQKIYEEVREAMKNAALLVHKNTDNIPEQTIAIRKLHEASMAINAAIALSSDKKLD
ncbi:MAG TPA: hypothetical protein VL443_08215 [Cyclobacteriaceae bacterium]|jgi:hypothetical protein|nr:hypothetical protein [Cyclobacteriaceae bacterium]